MRMRRRSRVCGPSAQRAERGRGRGRRTVPVVRGVLLLKHPETEIQDIKISFCLQGQQPFLSCCPHLHYTLLTEMTMKLKLCLTHQHINHDHDT